MGFTGGYYTGGGNDSSVGLMATFFIILVTVQNINEMKNQTMQTCLQ